MFSFFFPSLSVAKRQLSQWRPCCGLCWLSNHTKTAQRNRAFYMSQSGRWFRRCGTYFIAKCWLVVSDLPGAPAVMIGAPLKWMFKQSRPPKPFGAAITPCCWLGPNEKRLPHFWTLICWFFDHVCVCVNILSGHHMCQKHDLVFRLVWRF